MHLSRVPYHNVVDAVSVPRIAAGLGVSVPRAHRLLDRHRVPPAPGPGKARLVPEGVGHQLEREIGTVPKRSSRMTREAILVAKAISAAPLGLRSARQVARLTGVSPTTATRVLHDLEARGLVTQRRRTVASGTAVERREWVPLKLAAWPAPLLADMKAATLPEPPVRDLPMSIPPRFAHLFWNVDVRTLALPKDAAFVASRLLSAPDPIATAWAATMLPREAVDRAVSTRGFPPRDRWLANVRSLA